MHFKQFYLGCLAHASYLIGDESTGTAVVVDPQRDIDLYLKEAEAHGLTIRHVFLTHFHADFVAGHLELRDRVGAEVHLGARAEAEFPFTPAREGEALELGRLRLEFLETPGHTPEGVSIVVRDLDAETDEPFGVLTGDTLFVGDVGRPDLLASIGVTEDELARALYHSLHEKLMKLPDATRVYPAHGAGSLCGKNLGSETWSTIGMQRQANLSLRPMTEDEFVAMVTTGQPTAPQYFVYDAIMNREEHDTLGEALERELVPLSLDDVLRAANAGAVVIDTRSPFEFAAGHLAGSTAISLEGSFATWSGTLIAPGTPIVVVAEPGQELEAVTRLGRIGFESVRGFLAGGSAAWAERDDVVQRVALVGTSALRDELEAGSDVAVVDVRSEGERSGGAIDGSLHVTLAELPSRTDELPRDRRVVLTCANISRAMTAASLSQAAGVKDVRVLEGGWAAWQAARASAIA